MFFHGGYFGFDDIEYCRLADSVLKGTFSHDSLYAHRYASFIPLALSYMVLGVGDLANFIIGFLVLLATVLIMLKVLKDAHLPVRWLASLFVGFAPMYLMYVEKPMPDIIVAFGFLLSLSSYISYRFDKSKYRYSGVIFSLGVITMFLAKETFLIFYPFFVVLFIHDVFYKKEKKFWGHVVLGLLVFGMLYASYAWFVFGDVLARIHHIFAGQYISACSYDLQPFSATLHRIGYQLWFEFARNLYLIPLCFVPILWKAENEKIRFIVRSFVGLLLLANFMSISYTSYVPLCPDPRHHIYILPIGAMVMAYGFQQIPNLTWKQFYTVLAILIALLLLSVYKGFESSWWVYLPLIGGTIAAHRYRKTIMSLLIGVSVLSIFVQNATYNVKVNYKDQKRLNDYVISEVPGFKYVITDRVNHDYGKLHSGFDTRLVHFVDYKALDTFNFVQDLPCYLIGNGMTSFLSNTTWESLPEVAQTAHEKLPKVYENKAGTVYRVR